MRPDGDPEPDDYGLPRIDVVVPDDARELEREVVAYRREERQRRRRARTRRLLRPFTRFGVAVPIIAGALLVALLSGALMTAFGPRPVSRPSTSMITPHPTAPIGQIGGTLPDGEVTVVSGQRRRQRLQALRPGVLAVVPPSCACGKLVDELSTRTKESRVGFWLMFDRRGDSTSREASLKKLRTLQGAVHGGPVNLVEDDQGYMAGTYVKPGGKPAAVLVGPDGLVSDIVDDPQPGKELTEKVRKLQWPAVPATRNGS
ncbi:hypothetical protein [Actinomadura rudentiformis]|uniref:Uncharacterized protein n=1 Tax=Actinomadura rudentiformis TaxID=359158 RepID=A0A6H9Z0H7_9ACTN|nr:hypothetical protein [Actinomadura rudentiformis]KAB2347946.1 hypothetical protein F8566_18880 [Actinomadura rudentiformis]